MNKIRELDGVSDKEDGYIVTYQIIITFFSVELNRKSPNIPHCIRGTLTSCHCGEPHKDGSLVIRILQEFSLSVIVHWLINLEVTEGSGTLSMHYPLGNTLPIEVRDLLNELEVLQKSRTALAYGKRIIVVVNWITLTSGHIFAYICPISF